MATGGAGGGAGLTTRGQSFVASGIMLLGSGFVLGLGDLVRLGLLLVGLAAASVLLGRRSPGALAVRRVVTPSRLEVDEPAQVQLTVRNGAGRRTATLVAVELLARSLGDRPRFVLPPLSPGEERIVRYAFTPRVRGEIVLGPLAVHVRDSFGLSSRQVAAGGGHAVLVHPRVLDLGTGGAAGSAPGDGDSASQGVALAGDEDVSVRPYRHGDELRRIHWKATAHTGELMVRQEEQPSRRNAVVLLDSRASSHTGLDERSTFEWAVTAAASVVAHLASLGYDVRLVTDETADRLDTLVPSAAAMVPDPLAVLARARTGTDARFGRCVQVAGELSTRGGLTVAVLGCAPDDAQLLGATRHPGTRGLALVVREAGRADLAESTIGALERRGWRTSVAEPSTPLARAWAAVSGRQGVGV